MTTAELPQPPREIEAEAARKFRDAAAKAGFDARVFGVLGMAGLPGWKATMRAAIPRLPSAECGVLAKFFIVRDGVTRDELTKAFGGVDVLDACGRAGMAVETDGGLLQCPFVLIPAAGVWAFSDAIGDPLSMHPPDDYIIPVSMSSRYVDDLTVRVPCELAVDMGCGQGYLALQSLRQARRCIATDINPRAIAFARANAALNGADGRIECRLGSFFEPVADVMGKVDLFTCNPPFFIQPGQHTTASASPTEGDGMLEDLVRKMPRLLREGSAGGDGGWATVIGIWEHADPSDWTSRVRGWLDGNGCDALALRFQTFRADEYFRYSTPPDTRAAMEPVWKALCEKRGIGALTYGGFVLRRRAGVNWFRSAATPIGIRSGGASDQLQAYFATQTIAESAMPGALMDRKLRVAAGWRYDPAVPLPKSSPPGSAKGLAMPLTRAAEREPLLAAFDGKTTARAVLGWQHFAGQIAHPAEHPETEALLRSLVLGGILDILD